MRSAMWGRESTAWAVSSRTQTHSWAWSTGRLQSSAKAGDVVGDDQQLVGVRPRDGQGVPAEGPLGQVAGGRAELHAEQDRPHRGGEPARAAPPARPFRPVPSRSPPSVRPRGSADAVAAAWAATIFSMRGAMRRGSSGPRRRGPTGSEGQGVVARPDGEAGGIGDVQFGHPDQLLEPDPLIGSGFGLGHAVGGHARGPGPAPRPARGSPPPWAPPIIFKQVAEQPLQGVSGTHPGRSCPRSHVMATATRTGPRRRSSWSPAGDPELDLRPRRRARRGGSAARPSSAPGRCSRLKITSPAAARRPRPRSVRPWRSRHPRRPVRWRCCPWCSTRPWWMGRSTCTTPAARCPLHVEPSVSDPAGQGQRRGHPDHQWVGRKTSTAGRAARCCRGCRPPGRPA